MKYSVFYSSVTGNTEKLAKAVEEVFAQDTKVEDPAEADLVCVGFWTREGNADEKSRNFLKTLYNRKIFLFGTAGFGDSQSYFGGLLEKVQDSMNDTNEVVGGFMCQGKVSQAARDLYHKLKSEVPHQGAHYDLMIANADKGVTHPDADDIDNLKAAAKAAAEKLG